MRIIEIQALSNGAHRNQAIDKLHNIPEGWAIIPDNIKTENFPFGEVTVEEVDGVMTVVNWVAGEIPELELIEEQPTKLDIIEAQATYTAMMTDTLLGV